MIRLAALLCLLPVAAIAAENAERGAGLFQEHCAVCHGSAARGDGPMALALSIPPANLTLLAEGNDGTFPLERVLRRVDGRTEMLVHGGPMPLFGEVLAGPSVAMAAPGGEDVVVSEAVGDIVAWLMSVQE